VQDLMQNDILVSSPSIRYAFRHFLVAKQSGAARPILDMSPWTMYYDPPPIRLYSAAEVLTTIPRQAYVIKIDLRSGFFQIKIHRSHWKCTTAYSTRADATHGHAYRWATHWLYRSCNAWLLQLLDTYTNPVMYAWLHTWMTGPIPVNIILLQLSALGLTIHFQKSTLQPTQVLTYLGLNINTITRTLRATDSTHASTSFHRAASIQTRSSTDCGLHILVGIRNRMATVSGKSHSQQEYLLDLQT
jgi:hypothetical protein